MLKVLTKGHLIFPKVNSNSKTSLFRISCLNLSAIFIRFLAKESEQIKQALYQLTLIGLSKTQETFCKSCFNALVRLP